MNLNILTIDILNHDGILDTFRFIPKNEYNSVMIDKIKDIHKDVKGNTDKDIGLNRIYNSETCELIKTRCKLKNTFNINENDEIDFSFEHIDIPLQIGSGGAGVYNLIIPKGYRLEKIYFSDPYDKKSEKIENKKQFKFSVIWDKIKLQQICEMKLRSNRGSFSFIVKGKLIKNDSNPERFYESNIVENDIYFDSEIDNFFFDSGIKKSFLKNLKDSLMIEPNFYGIGFNIKKFFSN